MYEVKTKDCARSSTFQHKSFWACSIRPKIPVWISDLFVCRMERYFPPGRTDLVLFPLEHISHQQSLDKMLTDRDEVAVLSAVLSCFMWRSLTRIFLNIYEKNLRTFLVGEYANRANWPTGNSERPVHNFHQILTFSFSIKNRLELWQIILHPV